MRALITFVLLVLEILKKYHKGDLAGHCPICIYVYMILVIATGLRGRQPVAHACD